MKRLVVPAMVLALAAPVWYAPSARADSGGRGQQTETQDLQQQSVTNTRTQVRETRRQNHTETYRKRTGTLKTGVEVTQRKESHRRNRAGTYREPSETSKTGVKTSQRQERRKEVHKEVRRERHEEHKQTIIRHRQRVETRRETRRQRYRWHDYRPGHRPPEWEKHRRDFDRHAWELNLYSRHRYHWRLYHRPKGWYYHVWSYGEILPLAFWAKPYWILTYWDFGLPDPPYGFVWVHYDSDAVLVDVENGMILRVVYNVFY